MTPHPLTHSQEPSMATPARTAEILPVSAAQRRFWLIDQLQGPSGVYNSTAALRLRGPLDVAALGAAFQLLVDRHEALRTVFPARAGTPVQLILPRRAFEPALVEPPQGTRDERAAWAADYAASSAERPFDLTKGPLLRAELIAVGVEEHFLVVVLHHIVVDRWSFGLMMAELSEAYAARVEGRAVDLPELAIRYGDHVARHQALLDGPHGAGLLKYWLERLRGAPAGLELPTDRPRPASRSFRGATVPMSLGSELSAEVRAFGRKAGLTPFMVLLAALQATLARYSGSEDIVVSTGPATRPPGTERLVGCLVNTVLLRTSLAGDPTFDQLAAQVRENTLDAFEHRELPFDRLVEALAPTRDLSRNPLTQVGFVLQNAPATVPALTGLAVEALQVDRKNAHMDLDLQLTEEDGRFTGFVEYALDLFDADTVAQLVEHWTTLLTAAVRAPGTPLAELAMLTGAQTRRALVEWNDTAGAFPADACLHELIDRQVRSRPRETALVDASGPLDYARLWAWSGRIAGSLRALGVGPDVPVAVCVERGAALVAGMLGVLRAGGAFLALDPEYPRQRLAAMLQDARPAAVVAHRATAALLPSDTPALLLEDIPQDAPEFTGPTGVTATHLAYLVFTSGSTGRPKCVEVTHRGIVNTFTGMALNHGLGPGDRLASLHSPSFDPAVHGCLAPLMAGAAVVLPAHQLARDPHHWVDLVQQHAVTVWDMTPSATEALLAAAVERGEQLSTLRLSLIGGDVMPPALPAQLRQVAPNSRLFNMGGVAEVSFCSNSFPVPQESTGTIPYGRPLLNQRMLVLDDRLRLVPPGVPGELCLAGEGVSRGYLGRPGSTAERFVPDPFGELPGARLYRTGDRARWRKDGVVELLGRMDFQVKIRGFRVEPGEVSAVLQGHPDVVEAVVAARADAVTGHRLAAWWVGRGGVGADQLAAYLRERLPAHMVPVDWTRLAALPLSPNGKVDRAALPEPASAPTDAVGTPPRPGLETEVAAIWQRLLEVPRVDATADFFSVGGHSLLANRLVSALRAAYGVELRLLDVFESATVARQAALVERLLAGQERDTYPPVRPTDREQPLPPSFAQQRMWWFDQLTPGSAAYHIPTAVRITGPLDTRALDTALCGLLRRHEVLRTTVSSVDGVPSQRVLPVPGSLLVVSDLPDEERLPDLVHEFAVRPFALGEELPLRAQLLRVSAQDHVLLLTVHHIAMDGWSMAILVDDLGALYDARTLPPLPVQYGDYAVWQAEQADSGLWQEQLAHWRTRLAGPLRVLELPTDRPRPAMPSLSGAVHEFRLPPSLTSRLRRLAGEHGATLFMVLLAGYQALLGRLSGTDDVVVGTPVAGRPRPELEELVGCFVNTLALRGDLSGDPSFGELLRRTRERTLTDFDHGDIPLERVLDAVGADRDPARHPLFQTMLTLQSARPPRPGFDGLTLAPLPAGTDTCLMDLMFTAVEEEESLAFTVEYATDLFDAATVTRLADRFTILLDAAVAEPGTALSRLPLTDAAERDKVLTRWNATRRPIPATTLHELVAAQAARTPEAPALEHGGRTLSYRELETEAERCAELLRGLGAGPETLVAVSAGPSPDLVVALLGVLKAGAAFVTLDPAHPPQRTRQLLELSGARLVLTGADGPAHSAELFEGLAVARIGDRAPQARTARADVRPANLACVFFTSGTTGTPKGSMFDHRGLVNFSLAMAEQFGLGCGDRFLQLASVGFDVLLEELFPALVSGATVVLPGARLLADGVDLTDYLARHRITGLELTTAYWHEWVAELTRSGTTPPPGLRFVAMGGERVRRDLLATWQGFGVPLVHVYGLTEAGCTSTTEQIDAHPVPGELPIGRPLPNTTCYLLDPQGRPVPLGSSGELYLGGAGVARGYLGRPGQTAERFLPDPFDPMPGTRLYRTGDLARHREDGKLEFLGRADQQVKIRGHRIEPAEVETRLAARPEVGRCTVLVREDQPGEKRLVAYVTPAGEVIDPVALRSALREELPGYLVPSAVVVLDSLPLNANGKLDRAALPRPTRTAFGDPQAVATPRTPAEATIAALACELLDLDVVGIHDNLFDLGLHSMLAARFAARVRGEFETELPLRVFFEEPSVAGLALRILQAQAEQTDLDDLEELLAELEAADGAPNSRA